MFGVLTKFRARKTAKDRDRAAQILGVFQAFHQDTPGGAYIFARTLYQSRETIDVMEREGVPPKEQMKKLATDITDPRYARTRGAADGGIGKLGRQYARMALKVQHKDPINGSIYMDVIDEITKHGTRYRGIELRDYRSPEAPEAREIVLKSGYICVADLISAVDTDYEQLAQNLEYNDDWLQGQNDERIWTLLALFDLRQETRTGKLATYIEELGKLIN